MSGKETLGVDIGGVIISKVSGADTSFSALDFLETPEMPDAVEVIRRLAEERFGERVYLVSKCGSRVQTKTLKWLDGRRFFERAGVSPRHVRFCRERSEKATICSKLGVTHFIDDRLDVLQSLRSVPNRFLLESNPQARDTRTRAGSPNAIRVVTGWSAIGGDLLALSSR